MVTLEIRESSIPVQYGFWRAGGKSVSEKLYHTKVSNRNKFNTQ